MILKTEELKNACSKILTSMDNSDKSIYSGRVEFKTKENILYMNVTNSIYFVEVKLGECMEEFHATIGAEKFLKLVSQVTTELIEFNVSENFLNVSANGKYKFALIYENSEVLELPRIIINNPTLNFNIESKILNSILTNNSRELSKIPKDGRAINELQKMYYVDEQGAITFYNGACVNKFELEKPVKLLIDASIVKLFSLFKDEDVAFTLGYDSDSEFSTTTKIELKSETVIITAKLSCTDTLIQQMPVAAIREKAFGEFPYNMVINRNDLLAAIKRLTLFTTDAISFKTCGKFTFKKNCVVISDFASENTETLIYANELPVDLTYDAMFDLIDIKLAIDSNKDQFISMGFGNHISMIVAKDNIYTLIPEIVAGER